VVVHLGIVLLNYLVKATDSQVAPWRDKKVVVVDYLAHTNIIFAEINLEYKGMTNY